MFIENSGGHFYTLYATHPLDELHDIKSLNICCIGVKCIMADRKVVNTSVYIIENKFMVHGL